MNLLPWFSWLRLFPLNLKLAQIPRDALSLEKLFPSFHDENFDTLRTWADLYREFNEGSGEYLSELNYLIRPIWIGELGRTGEHHDVANLLAPLVLYSGLERLEFPISLETQSAIWGGSSRVWAFAKLMKWLDAVSDESFCRETPVTRQPSGKGHALPSESPLNSELVAEDLFGRFATGVRFLLIDDKALTGYARILATLLFGADAAIATPTDRRQEAFHCTARSYPQFTLEASISPNSVLEMIDTLIQKGESEGYTKVFPTFVAQDKFDILFLDLRLFPTFDEGKCSEEEKAFLHKVQITCSRAGFKKHLRGIQRSEIGTRLLQALEAVRLRLEGTNASGPTSQAPRDVTSHLSPALVDTSRPLLPNHSL